MAKKCCVCGAKLGFLDAGWDIISTFPDYLLCDTCHTKYRKLKSCSEEEYENTIGIFRELLDSPNTPKAIKDQFPLSQKQAAQKRIDEQVWAETVAKNFDAMILTTGSTIEGYRVVRYVDVVCEEVVFKNSFKNWLSAEFEDLGNAFTFQESEFSGSSDLIKRARLYAKNKFRNEVANLGANAALGVEFESSIGSDIVRVAIFGTAVVIEKT